ncbi:DUF2797 domain-containing protein [Haloarcula hispanica]|uniref:DUF2797 domain-containing protein n=1 Tax=Haloarcula hispanica TaxID=51589 RepID=A0A482TDY8_HALHI|nr:DUF2797 domain-containing protein [Haloarcula hispanica]MCJ0620283.1 DUF2797 domain-containing protein [Haloarcula hispanica]RYJ10695.1 DUF2797 domain-containing protein [Haloarcula hispanica]
MRLRAESPDVQVVGYHARVDEHAALLLAEDGSVTIERLDPGTELSYTLGERHCAGAVDGDRHFHCDNDPAPYCPEHTDIWPCARCTGDCNKPLETCDEEHAVYLAAFASDTVKVGVTRSWRLETRLREQGADRAAHLRTVADGRIARQVEADIAVELGDRVRVPTKISGFDQSVDTDWWASLCERYDPLAIYDFEYDLSLSDRPMAETLATGTVRGTKGRVAVLENNSSVYAVDLRQLVGYELTDGGTDRDLQSSLGAFR